MSNTFFNPTDHPRAADGTFVTKPGKANAGSTDVLALDEEDVLGDVESRQEWMNGVKKSAQYWSNAYGLARADAAIDWQDLSQDLAIDSWRVLLQKHQAGETINNRNGLTFTVAKTRALKHKQKQERCSHESTAARQVLNARIDEYRSQNRGQAPGDDWVKATAATIRDQWEGERKPAKDFYLDKSGSDRDSSELAWLDVTGASSYTYTPPEAGWSLADTAGVDAAAGWFNDANRVQRKRGAYKILADQYGAPDIQPGTVDNQACKSAKRIMGVKNAQNAQTRINEAIQTWQHGETSPLTEAFFTPLTIQAGQDREDMRDRYCDLFTRLPANLRVDVWRSAVWIAEGGKKGQA